MQLLGPFDTFADDLQPQALAEVDDAARELRLIRVALDVVDKGFVDLQRVDRQMPQVRQRRIAGPEVVDRDPHAEFAQFAKARDDGVGVADQHALGDLKDQQAGREARRRQRLADALDEAGVAQPARRDVDAERKRKVRSRLAPLSALRAGGLEDPAAERDDQPGVLREPDELVGSEQLASRMVPADECLDPDAAATLGGHDLLVVEQNSLPSMVRASGQLEPLHRAIVHVRLERADGGATLGLGRVHRDVGVAQQLLDAGSRRGQSDADRGRHAQVPVADHERAGQRPEDPIADEPSLLIGRIGLQQHGELVAAEPRRRVGRAQDPADPPGHSAQEIDPRVRARGCR